MNHSFNVELAEKYGMEGAVLIEHIYWWIHKNECDEIEDMQHEGRIWCRSTAKGFAKYISYMKPDKIWRTLKKLEGDVLLVGNFNRQATNQTLWYTFTDEFKTYLKKLGYDFENFKNGILNNSKSYNNKEDIIKEDSKRLSNDNPKGIDDLFVQFWERYDYKKGKAKAEAAWRKLSKKEKLAAIDAIDIYKEDCRKCDREMRYPATYINSKTWKDDFSCSGKLPKEEEKEEWPNGLTTEEWQQAKHWLDGNAPRISDKISPADFIDMKGRAHFKRDVFIDIIIEINNSGYDGDILSEFERLRFTEPYATRIDL